MRVDPRWMQLIAPLAACLAYLPNLDDFFVSDDFDHPFVQGYSFEALWRHLTAPAAAGDFFRPLTRVSMGLDHALWGASPEPSHAVNLLLHAATAWLVSRLATRLLRRDRAEAPPSWSPVGVCAGVLFALHPIHPEAVSFLGARFDLLSGFFAAAALLAHVRAAEEDRPRWLVLSTVCFVASILSKEAGLFVPVAVLFYELLCAPSRRWIRLLPGFVALAAYAGFRVLVIGSTGGYETGLGASRHIPTLDAPFVEQFFGFVGYGLVTPVNTQALGEASTPLVITLAAVFAAVLLTTVVRRRGGRPLVFLLLATLVAALPASTLYSTWGLRWGLEGARFLYVPSIPFCIGLAAMLDALVPGSLRRVAGAAQLVLYAGLCVVHVRVWSDASDLARDVVSTVQHVCDDLEGPEPTVFIYGAPDNHQGAFVFRNGIPAAVAHFHPQGPRGRFFRSEMEPDFFDADALDIRDAVGRRDVCVLVWDTELARLDDRTDVLRQAARRTEFDGPTPRGEGEGWWEDWSLFEAEARAPEGGRWVIDAAGDDPQFETRVPMGVRALEVTLAIEPHAAGVDPLGEVFWAVDEVPFATPEAHHRLFEVHVDGAPHTYTLPVPLADPAQLDARWLRVRVDPTVFPARVVVGPIRFVTRPYGPTNE